MTSRLLGFPLEQNSLKSYLFRCLHFTSYSCSLQGLVLGVNKFSLLFFFPLLLPNREFWLIQEVAILFGNSFFVCLVSPCPAAPAWQLTQSGYCPPKEAENWSPTMDWHHTCQDVRNGQPFEGLHLSTSSSMSRPSSIPYSLFPHHVLSVMHFHSTWDIISGLPAPPKAVS